MSKVNVVLYQPDHPRFTILQSYQEVMDSLEWGLRELGFETRQYRNVVDPRAVNIVFGWIPALLLNPDMEFPPNTILYNLEQFSVGSLKGAKALEAAAARYQIWDYSAANVPRWQELAPRYPVYHAPVSYAPNLERLPAGLPEDIDMLYIGSLGIKRSQKLIDTLSASYKNSLVSLSNIWGAQRDHFIARSKILLNVSNDNPRLKIFEVVRVSYYLANRKAVLSELCPDHFVEADLQQVLRFYGSKQLGFGADTLLADPALRERYARDCYEVFRRRDVRDVIRGYFR